MMDKKSIVFSLILTAMILVGCILNLHALILISVAIICLALVLLDTRRATLILFFFTPLSYILVYNQYNIYVFLMVAYICGALLRRKNAIAILPALFVAAYCVIFSSPDVAMNLGKFISPLLLSGLLFVCYYAERQDYKYILSYFMMGFMVSIVIGFFKNQIPLIRNIFEVNNLVIDGTHSILDFERFSGLSYDPNFFALIDCVLISALLFGEKKTNWLKAMALIALTVIGFFTFSKSFVILIAVIFVLYIFTRTKAPIKILLVALLVGGCLFCIEKFTSLKIISLISARFAYSDTVNDLTTGRASLWIEYLNYIFNDVRCFLVGEGFNALSLEKAAHNTYIEFIYHFGLIGASAWLVYFVWCKRAIDRLGKRKASLNATAIVLMLGLFFLNSLQFQQTWCCIFIALISPYIGEDNNEEFERNSADIQRRKIFEKVH